MLKARLLKFGDITKAEGNNLLFVPDRVNILDKSDYSINVTSRSMTNNDTSISPGGRDFDRLPFGLFKGNSYTFFVEVTVLEPLKGGLHPKALQMDFVLKTTDGVIDWEFAKSGYAINESGSQILVLNLNIPMNAVGGVLRLNTGVYEGSGIVQWSSLSVIDGYYPIQSYFSSKYGDLLKYDKGNILANPKLMDYFRTELYKPDNFFPQINKLYSRNASNIRGREELYDSLSIIQEKQSVNELEELLNDLGKYVSFFDHIDTERFVQRSRVYGGAKYVERFELLEWLFFNLEKIQAISTTVIDKSYLLLDELPILFSGSKEFIRLLKL